MAARNPLIFATDFSLDTFPGRHNYRFTAFHTAAKPGSSVPPRKSD